MKNSVVTEYADVIKNMLNAIASIGIQAEVKEGDTYIATSKDLRINQILERDGSKFLSRMYYNYIIYGRALAYKAKTIRACLAEYDGNPIYEYWDGAVAGVHVIDSNLWNIDENIDTGELYGVYIGSKGSSSVNEMRNYLKRREFIYSTDWAPMGKQTHSIGWFIKNTDEPVSALLGIDNDLITNPEGQSVERRNALIKRAMQDTIIPAASKFVMNMQNDIGLQNDMRLVLKTGDTDTWISAWNKEEPIW